MIVISDANILSSFAAADALDHLRRLFPKARIAVPPSVVIELRNGLDYGKSHLKTVLDTITENDIDVLPLSRAEEKLRLQLPQRLNAGECEGIVLAQNRNLLFLSNDKKAFRYCHREGIQALDLVDLLRLLWIQSVCTQKDVAQLIQKMVDVEKLVLRQKQLDIIFEPRTDKSS
ncbi:MAG: hypothetical protein AAF702_12495 [Chloroflexota bacterium]